MKNADEHNTKRRNTTAKKKKKGNSMDRKRGRPLKRPDYNLEAVMQDLRVYTDPKTVPARTLNRTFTDL